MIRILVVDDYDVVRRAVRGLLNAAEGLKVVGEARDGEQALSRAEELQPDVVVMDILMPKLNGFRAAAKICERLSRTKIVFLSLYAESELVQKAFQAGGIGYVLKQNSAQELIQAVCAAVEERPFLSPTVKGLPLPDAPPGKQ